MAEQFPVTSASGSQIQAGDHHMHGLAVRIAHRDSHLCELSGASCIDRACQCAASASILSEYSI